MMKEPRMDADERGWKSRLGWLFMALLLGMATACQKRETLASYDNTQERAAFYERYNAEVLEKLR